MDDSVRYIMADSSVQGHHDLELIRCVTLRVSQHDDMFRCAQELHAGLAEADALEADIQEAAAKERDLLSNISKRFVDPLVSKRCHRQRACKLVPQKSCTSPYRVAGNGRLPLDGSLLQDSAVFLHRPGHGSILQQGATACRAHFVALGPFAREPSR